MSLGKRISILSPHFNLLAPLLAAILLAINYLPGLCGAGQYMTADGMDSSVPQMVFAAEWIRRGVFPLWNPTACFGMPQLAYAILSPLSPTVLLYVAMPFQVAAIAEKLLIGRFHRHVFLCIGDSCCTSAVGQEAWEVEPELHRVALEILVLEGLLVLEQEVMHLPELALFARGDRRSRGRHGPHVLVERIVLEDEL
ncbi:MAG: hypothetical protein AAB229_07520, partial [Candidatus Hydrogenedentota bacterium]